MYPIVRDFKDFHGKIFVHRGPAHFRILGAGSFSEIGLIIFDDSALIFLGSEGRMDPVIGSVQILQLFPVTFG